MRGRVIDQLRTTSLTAGVESLRAAALAGADPIAVAIVAWERLFGGHPRLTAKRRVHLVRAARRADRYANFAKGQRGAGAALLVDLMISRAELLKTGHADPVHTLDFFVCELRAIARRWRRAERGRGRVRDTGQISRQLRNEARRRG